MNRRFPQGSLIGYRWAVSANEMPTLPWHKQQRRRAGKEPLTQDRIVAAAIGILDSDGLDAVSTRRVAEALGTGSASPTGTSSSS
jgi:hypothetical protein